MRKKFKSPIHTYIHIHIYKYHLLMKCINLNFTYYVIKRIILCIKTFTAYQKENKEVKNFHKIKISIYKISFISTLSQNNVPIFFYFINIIYIKKGYKYI